jgi:ABC-type branched-subunit amino acid transport system substrate-binding protein
VRCCRRAKLALFAAVLAVAGCAGRQETTPPYVPQPFPEAPSPAAEPAGPPPVRVGLLLPLTGTAANLGQDLLEAAQLALFEVPGHGVELLPRDTGDRPEQAQAAARAALDAGAELLIGPLFARSATAVAPIAAERGLSVLSFSNDASIAGGGVYVLGFRPEEQIARVVAYAAGQGLTRFGALAPEDAYGSRGLAAWRAAVALQPGADAAVAASYPADGGDPGAAVREVAAVGRPEGLPAADGPEAAPAALPPPGVDAVLIADGGPRVSAIAAGLERYGVAPPATRLLGTLRWQDDPELTRDPRLDGAWLATWPSNAVAAFARKFQAAYGRAPAPLAVLAYDATALAALLSRAEPPRFTAAQLTDPAGFAGGAGIFRLLPDGTAEHGLAVVEIDRGGTRLLEPAPAAFAAGAAQRWVPGVRIARAR